MSDESTTELVQAWHRFFANIKDKQKRAPDLWAAKKVGRLLHDWFLVEEENEGIVDDPERAWEVILLLIEAAPYRKTLLAVISPMRQLLDAYFDQFIARVRTEAGCNDRLAYVLSHTYIHNDEHREQVYALGRRAAVLDFAGEDRQEQSKEIEKLLATWFAWRRDEPVSESSIDWVIDQLYFELPDCDPNKYWLIISRLLAESQSEDELEHAGNLIEELLSRDYAEFIEVIKQAVQSNKRLAYALRSLLFEAEESEWSEVRDLVDRHPVNTPFAD